MTDGERKPEYPKDRTQPFAITFHKAMRKARVAQSLGGAVYALLSEIAWSEDDFWYSRPIRLYNDQLMERCGISGRDTLVRIRDRAIKSGWLNYIAGTKATPGLYWVDIPFDFRKESENAVQHSNENGEMPFENQTESENAVRFPAQKSYGKPAPSKPNNLIPKDPPNPPSQTTGAGGSSQTKFDPTTIELPEPLKADPAFLAAWKDWVQHRREIKHTLTPLATTKAINRLAAWGAPRAIRAIEHSIEKGWRGIFEPDEPTNGKPARTELIPDRPRR